MKIEIIILMVRSSVFKNDLDCKYAAYTTMRKIRVIDWIQSRDQLMLSYAKTCTNSNFKWETWKYYKTVHFFLGVEMTLFTNKCDDA